MNRFVLAALINFVAWPVAAQTPTIIDGSGIDQIISVARGFGSATIATQENGNPKIAGRISGVPYTVFFQNCADPQHCDDINFYAGFLNAKLAIEKINDWNRTKRFGRAYLDAEQDAVIEMDFNLQYGVTHDNLTATFNIWRLLLDQFTTYIGFK